MGRFVNPDNSAFQVALNSKIYVDKTGLIACMNDVLDSTDAYICNSRPRRFGKSYAANMLAAYYSKGAESEEMFSGLKIGKTEDFKKHLNKYDVIHIDVQWFLTNCEEADSVVTYITKTVLDELQEVYPKILSSEVVSLPDALSRIKNETGQKFIIIIDEWDVLIRDESSNKKVQDEYIRFLRSMFKGTEPTKYIQLAYLTGILPIKKERTQSALNNFREYSMLNAGPLASYIGFTEDEVKELCKIYKKDFSEVKHWYDGYQLGKYHVYNPNAVVSLMSDGNFQSYWSGTASYDSIVPLINMDFDGLKTSIIEMLSGASVEVDVASFQNDISNIINKDDVLTYLIHMGYLAYSNVSKRAFVPNEEIRQELIRATRRKKWNEMLNIIEINDFAAPELDVYARRTEAQLLNKDNPEEGLFIAESPKVIGRALDAGYIPVSVLVEKHQMEENEETRQILGRFEGTDIPIFTAEFEVLMQLTGFKLTRGMLCALKRQPLMDYQNMCQGKDRIVILENVMNPTNVGAIFRSAAALNMGAVLLTPGCSDPFYRRASRVSMGTVFQIPWTFIQDNHEMRCQREILWPEQAIAELRKMDYKTAALALTDDSVGIDNPELMKEEKLAIILGTEGEGLMNRTIELCDYTVKIPMAHGVDSLNVAAASAVAFWQLGKK